MNIGNIIKYLPIGSLINYTFKGKLEDKIKGISEDIQFLKNIGHVFYACVGITGGILWLSIYLLNTGVWNPTIRGMKTTESYPKVVIQEEYNNELRNKLNKLFGENGLADIDGDGKVSFSEIADVYERAGLGKMIVELDSLSDIKHVRFNISPSFKPKNLERAIQSYKSGKVVGFERND